MGTVLSLHWQDIFKKCLFENKGDLGILKEVKETGSYFSHTASRVGTLCVKVYRINLGQFHFLFHGDCVFYLTVE